MPPVAVIPAHKRGRARFSVAYARVVRTKRHGRYLVTRVNGRRRTVRVRLRLTDRRGHARRFTRTIRTNRRVRMTLPGLATARRVRLTVLG